MTARSSAAGPDPDRRGPVPGGPAAPAPPGPWHTHGWNRELSWRLIHAVIPRVPRLLRPPLHLMTTLVCYAAMPRERAAARRNLARITGRSGAAAHLLAFRLFYNFSKFMVAYTDLAPSRQEALWRRIDGGEATRRSIHDLIAEGNGLIIVTLHLGHREVGLALLPALGAPVHVVLRPDDREPEEYAGMARVRDGVRVVPAGESPLQSVDLLLALRRGEIVALMGDRPVGEASRIVTVCGAPLRIPAGPFLLARASGAPILIVTVPIRGHDRFAFEVAGPLRVGPDDAAVAAAAAEFGRILEAIIRRHPTQWFNFYDVWDAS